MRYFVSIVFLVACSLANAVNVSGEPHTEGFAVPAHDSLSININALENTIVLLTYPGGTTQLLSQVSESNEVVNGNSNLAFIMREDARISFVVSNSQDVPVNIALEIIEIDTGLTEKLSDSNARDASIGELFTAFAEKVGKASVDFYKKSGLKPVCVKVEKKAVKVSKETAKVAVSVYKKSGLKRTFSKFGWHS